jgi:hypothetical protein
MKIIKLLCVMTLAMIAKSQGTSTGEGSTTEKRSDGSVNVLFDIDGKEVIPPSNPSK